ncbi:MAG: 4-alpha-glucanotransferase, partial [Oscillospiraceae bacterium]
MLMPITALPSNYGIGTLGQEAYRFVDFLKKSGQGFWQILPIGPTGYGDSPYQSFSAFAANPYMIDLDFLVKDGLLKNSEISGVNFGKTKNKIEYGTLYEVRYKILEKAVNRLDEQNSEYLAFCKENDFWLENYGEFMAIKENNNMVGLDKWDNALRLREEKAMGDILPSLQKRVFFWKALQFLFYRQWAKLKAYANANGVKIIGDIPIYVSPDSADLWANPELFLLDENRKMKEVAGCPPDAFSKTGQLWGNPLYDWAYHLKTDCGWWVKRLAHAGSVYDVVRIDHFRGFEAFYAIPAKDKTAENGKWKQGPALNFVNCIKDKLPTLDIIAEDLGFLTQGVYDLLKNSGYPGMKVLQFAFDSREESDYLPHNYTKNSIVYTGTHDNTTTADWAKTAPPKDVAFAYKYMNLQKGQDFADALIRTALSSVCDTAIVPMADWLGQGAQGRINTPSTLGDNWTWRIGKYDLTNSLHKKIYAYTKMYGRTMAK